MVHLISVGMAIVTLGFGAVSVSAAQSPSPSAELVADQLASEIPSFWTITNIAITARVNGGDVVEPLIEQQFELVVAPKSDLYVEDRESAALFEPYTPILPTVGAKDTRLLYGSARSTYSAGKWKTELQLGSDVRAFGMPVTAFSGQTVVRGNSQQPQVQTRLRQNVAQWVRQELESAIKERQSRREAELRELQAALGSAMEKVQARYAAEKRELPASLEQFKLAQRKALERLRQHQEGEREKRDEEFQATIERAKTSHAAAVEGYNAEREGELEELRQQHESVVERLRQEHERYMEQIERDLGEKAAALQGAIEDTANLIAVAKQRLEEAQVSAGQFAPKVKRVQAGYALVEAVKDGHLGAVKQQLARGTEVDTRSTSGSTALMFAARGGNLELVQLLIANGADVHAGNANNGATPLMYAAQQGHLPVVKALLKRDVDIDVRVDGWTPLLLAIRTGKTKIAESLLEAGANVNAANEGWTALMYAAYVGNAAMVRAMVAKGADIDASLSDGRTARQIAKQQRHEGIVNFLRVQ